MPVILSGLGAFTYGLAAEYLGTPVRQRSDTEIRLWSAGGLLPVGAMAYFSWRMVVGEGVSSPFKIVGGILGTISTLAALLAALTTISPGPFVRSMSELKITTKSGVPKFIFKGKGA